MKQGIRRFFAYARARHQIHLDREAGRPRPWTRDPILRRYKFTNVFRELDRTTRWFAKHVREPLRDKPEVLLSTVVFRMLNRIATGEAIFSQLALDRGVTAFELFAATSDAAHMKRAIKQYCGKGPYVTGAYIITSPQGYDKLTGMMRILQDFARTDWCKQAETMLEQRGRIGLVDAWEWLKEQPYFGPFHSYEIVTDLRHTALLSSAPDIMTWANPGPGARRGLNRVHNRDVDHPTARQYLIEEMQELLAYSRSSDCWPQRAREWPRWEMREVEHTLCEFDKYERVRLGEGTPRGLYK